MTDQFRHDPKTLEDAKKLYMEYEPIATISKATNLKHSTISYHVNKQNGWRTERELYKADLLEKVVDSKRASFAKMTVNAISVVERCLADIATRGTPPTTTEAQRCMQILESLDRITRLDDGAPTEIVAEKPMALETIHTIVASDPFHKQLDNAKEALEAPNEQDTESN
jgi:hypothetical protein